MNIIIYGCFWVTRSKSGRDQKNVMCSKKAKKIKF